MVENSLWDEKIFSSHLFLSKDDCEPFIENCKNLEDALKTLQATGKFDEKDIECIKVVMDSANSIGYYAGRGL